MYSTTKIGILVIAVSSTAMWRCNGEDLLQGVERETRAVHLVRAGRPTASLVVPADAPADIREAANDLAYWIGELTGARLAVAMSPSDGLVPVCFTKDAPEVAGGGFRLTATDR